MNTSAIAQFDPKADTPPSGFPLEQWYVGGFAWELSDKPLARTLLNMQRCGGRPRVNIHVDAGPNRARRIVERLRQAGGV